MRTIQNTKKRLIAILEFGSKLYGTQIPGSDVDHKFVFVPDGYSLALGKPETHMSDPLLFSLVSSPFYTMNRFPYPIQTDDLEGFSISRFLEMVTAGQTMAMDMLFVPERSIIYEDATWAYIRTNKHKLVSKRIEPFVGYCRTQMNKYCVKAERLSAAREVVDLLQRLPQKAYLEEYKGPFKELFEKHPNIVEDTGTHLSCCGRKADWNSMVERATLIFKNVLDKYGERSKLAEENLVDWKSVYHAVRVCHEAEELLSTCFLTFPRPEAPLLLQIRMGEIPIEKVRALIEEKVTIIESLLKTTELPDRCDPDFVENLIVSNHLVELGWCR